MKSFVGRRNELVELQELYDRKITSLAVIKGRRRVGKSRLVTEFVRNQAENHPDKRAQFFNFAGLAPAKGVTSQMQRDHFGRTLSSKLNIPIVTFQDWSDAFTFLSHQISPGDIILLDELSWMGHEDPGFVSKLKVWWDTMVLEKPHVLLVLCSSVSIWIEKNILKSTAFFGRISLTITLPPFTISESAYLLKLLHFKGSDFEVYKLLAILGGIPWYLEHINHKMMADENIKKLCFKKDALLLLEFDRIFHDLFNGKGAAYKKILEFLINGTKTLAEIRHALQFSHGGTLSTYVNQLIECGFVQEHAQWSLKKEIRSKQSLYRLSDPYVRYYLKNIEPNRAKIDLGAFDELDIKNIPGFDTHMGLQVENLLLQNRLLLLKALGISPSECHFDGPYRQVKTTRTRGCQIDYLVQTHSKNLFLCEFKFKRRELGVEIIEEVQEKMHRFSVPRGFAMVPVLFHMGGVTETVYDKQFFYRIIDITDFLEQRKSN